MEAFKLGQKDRSKMFVSAQKAPVVSAALSALNLAVVRTAVFERAAEQISEKSEQSTEVVVRTAEENRERSEAVTVVIEQSDRRAKESTDSVESATAELSTPDSNTGRGQSLNIEI